jgi:photosystem II stability/assembly factor-like uncharacterized protein
MKQFTIIGFIFFIVAISANGQQLRLKAQATNQNEKSFYQIQKEFNDYWAPYNVVNGYYTENGELMKAPGWKQFKRWEYYWENRVNPSTGAFPKTTAADEYLKIQSQRNTRSSAGSWTSMGPSSSPGGYEGLGRINCVAFRPGDDNTYYAGSPSGGLWKTTDNGANWTVLTDENEVLGVSDAVIIAGTTTETDTVYIATGDRDGGSMHTLGSGNWNDNNSIGVLKSTDGGTTWNNTGLSFAASDKKRISRLLLDPSNNNILYAATSSGVYKSTDAGASWTQITTNVYVDMQFKPGNSSVIYGSSRFGKIYLSTDSGTSWSLKLDKNLPGYYRRIQLAVSENEPSRVYAVVADANGSLYGVYKSTDSGNNYTLVYDGSAANHNLLGYKTDGSDSGGQGGYDIAIAASDDDADVLYIGGINTQKSSDGGTSWTAVSCWTSWSVYNKNSAPEVHADKHMLKYRNSDNTLFETNDGGIYYTTDGGSNWTDITNGIIPSQMYRLGISATSSTEVITGLQDNGTKFYSGGIWDNAKGGDGMECAIDYTDYNIQYASGTNGRFERTTNHWGSSTDISGSISDTAHWVTPFIIDPNTHTTLYMGRQDVWKSTDQGTNWSKISTIHTDSKFRSLAVAQSNSQVIYAADPDHIWVTLNGGTTWSEITGTLPVGSNSITYITVKDDDSATAWVSLGQYNSDGVYETTDAGATWTNISTGLPEIPIMCVIQNKQDTTQTQLYAGTDLGVYVKNGSGAWTAFNSGLPNVVVNELEIYYNDAQPALSKLRAATSGRGLWESDLYSPPNTAPVADFTADVTNPGIGQTVSFTDMSTNVPTMWNWSITPNTFQYTSGTNDTSQNIEIKFNATGLYTVQLIASNAFGSDTIEKNNYINVKQLLTYCDGSGESTNGDEYIKGVVLETINNTGTPADEYHDYTSLSTQLTVGQHYNITITNGNSFANDDLGIWIDWNHDGDFDDIDENIVCNVDDNGQGTFGFNVPNTAKLVATTMRVRIKWSGSNCGTPCGTTNYGEVEDYAIEVMPGSNTWVGTTTQWNDASNWSAGIIPTSSYNVTIPASPTGGNFPEIPSGLTAKCNKLTLENNATITINGDLEIEQQ